MASVYSVSLVNFTLLLFYNQDFTLAPFIPVINFCQLASFNARADVCVFVSKSNNQYGHFVLKSEMKTENNAADAALKSAITTKKKRNEMKERKTFHSAVIT